ncbi:MAG TPA: uracil-DNA glycosylase, partial [Bacillota bacterium]|nr:uracil-DNA glycosylase [Bacillota bacterium]
MDTGRQQSLLDFMGESTGAAPPADPLEQLAELKESCLGCSRCGLRRGCTQVVFGEGNPRSLLMLVGEGPGAEEDRLGRPFVGAAGQLLNRIIESLGWRREDLYIANIVKCRP